MKNPKKRILYIYPGGRSTFIAKDIRLLSEKFVVEEYYFNSSNKKLLPWELIKQLGFLKLHLFRYDLYLIKFSGYWSLMPVLLARFFGRKSIIITGGTDCVGFPSIGYGNFQNPLLAWFTKVSFKLASKIVALHKSMLLYDYTYTQEDYAKQGILQFIPNLKTPYIEIYNGYDADFWTQGQDKEPQTYITVASGLGEERRRILKGIDLILELAVKRPKSKFIIVGGEESEMNSIPSNVSILPKKAPEELRLLYQKASFYLQLSLSEGFPNSLCEAMLCGCVPIVSNVSSMPFIIEGCGLVLKQKSVEDLNELLEAIDPNKLRDLGQKSRERIASNFTWQKRQQALVNLVQEK